MTEDDELLVAAEVAKLTRYSRKTVYTWQRRSDRPKPFLLGSRPVWRRSVVMAWIADQEKAAS